MASWMRTLYIGMNRGSGYGPGRSSPNALGGDRSGNWRGGRSFRGSHTAGRGRQRRQQHHRRDEGHTAPSFQQNRRFFGSTGRTYGPPQTEDLDRIEEIGSRTENSVSIAIEGCCHGQLEAIYERLRRYEQSETETSSDAMDSNEKLSPRSTDESKQGNEARSTKKIDLLICCGDFQSLRTPADFHSLAVPAKYRSMGAFHKYYNGDCVAPVLTIFCGGNHEASQPLSELYYGGWVAPKMYYLGAAGVVRYKGIRIGGLSGIYKSHDYYKSRNEIPPYDANQLRSIYHYRNVDVYRLACLAPPGAKSLDANHEAASGGATERREPQRIDVMVSHDWPQGIEQYGDTMDLIRRKPFFRQEINDNSLGSPPLSTLLHQLQPSYWFAAHLHVKFQATVLHPQGQPSIRIESGRETVEPKAKEPSQTLVPTQVARVSMIENALIDGFPISSLKEADEAATFRDSVDDATEIQGNASSTQFVVPESSNTSCGNSDLTELMTRFLSLDKCLPRRQYLSILHLPATATFNDSQNEDLEDTFANCQLEYDLEWLAILRKTHHLAASPHFQRVRVPSLPLQLNEGDMAWISERVGQNRAIPENFVPTILQKYDEGQERQFLPPPLPRMGNPQTDQLLELLQLEHLPNLTVPYNEQQSLSLLQLPPQPHSVSNRHAIFRDEDEIDLDEADSPIIQNLQPSEETTQEIVTEPLFDDTQQDLKKPRLDTDAPVA
jgi:lariat debranching enzyme